MINGDIGGLLLFKIIPQLSTVMLHYPESVVKDVTSECDLIWGCLEQNKLGHLKTVPIAMVVVANIVRIIMVQ